MAIPDLSNVPPEDLQHIAAGDMTKVSEPVLNYLAGKPQKVPTMHGDESVLPGAIAGGLKDVAVNAAETVPAVITRAVEPVLAGPLRLGARALAAVQGKDDTAAADAAENWLRQGIYTPGTQVQDPVGNAVKNAAGQAVDKTFGAAARGIEGQMSPENAARVEHVAGIGNDVINTIPGVAAVREGALATQEATAAAREAAAGGTATSEQLGFRGAEGKPFARTGAGETAGPELSAHNSRVGNIVINDEAGVAHGTTPSATALENARGPANEVYERVATSMPDGPLSDRAAAQVRSAGQPEGGRVSSGSPQAQKQIEQLRQELLEPTNREGGEWTGRNWLNESRGLRQDGYGNIASDDVSNQQLGRAQLDMARAIETHIDDSLPANGTVSLGDLQNARKQLAKNFTAQGILRGDTYDLRSLARVQRADPKLLDGNMRTAAEFADSHPEVTAPSNVLNEPSIMKDVGNLSLTKPATYVRPFTGAIGRMFLRGPTTLSRTNALFEGRSPNKFPPRTPGPVMDQPPAPQSPADRMTLADQLGVGGQATPRGEGIPLADLLSHGVEQPPAPGLTAGPMGAPAQPGIPFRVDPGHMAGGLELAPESGAAAPSPSLGDLAGVMSQGVPEGIATRTAQPGRISLGDLLAPEGLHPAPRKFSVNKKGKAREEG